MKGSFEYARYDMLDLIIMDLCDDGGTWNTPDVCDGEYEYDAGNRIFTISFCNLSGTPPYEAKGDQRKEIRILGDSEFRIIDQRQEKI